MVPCASRTGRVIRLLESALFWAEELKSEKEIPPVKSELTNALKPVPRAKGLRIL